MKLFAVRDLKAECFGAPMSIATKGLALRSFSDACQKQDSDLYRYPQDYILYELGEYEPNSGLLTGYPVPLHIATANSMRDERAIVLKEE